MDHLNRTEKMCIWCGDMTCDGEEMTISIKGDTYVSFIPFCNTCETSSMPRYSDTDNRLVHMMLDDIEEKYVDSEVSFEEK